ncbi:hypothetical protein BJF78_02665 [Pseudonocardia sp. CNS-139]|nr:hypothetical protein BJF78_02665 [Pseudonocardia sp. CNS-139]
MLAIFRPRARQVSVPLQVTRLLQNPLGQPAPEGERGDIVRISDGSVTVYLTPAEYDLATEAELRYLLAQQAHARAQAQEAKAAKAARTDDRRPT